MTVSSSASVSSSTNKPPSKDEEPPFNKWWIKNQFWVLPVGIIHLVIFIIIWGFYGCINEGSYPTSRWGFVVRLLLPEIFFIRFLWNLLTQRKFCVKSPSYY